MAPSAYCDANILIEALEDAGERGDFALHLFDAASDGRLRIVTSTLSLAETLVKPLASKDRKLARAYALLFNTPKSGLAAVEIDRRILARAAFVRVRKGSIRLPDAIHIATAECTGCDAILTRDKAWSGATRVPLLAPAADTLSLITGTNNAH